MSAEPSAGQTRQHADRFAVSRVMLVVVLLLLAGTFFLISPPPGQTYPSAIPWAPTSVLKPLIDLMSLGGLLVSVRGVEIKSLVFHLATVVGFVVLGWQLLRCQPTGPGGRGGALARSAQLLLGGWVMLSLLSGLWSGDPGMTAGQAALYALGLGWAVAVGHTLDRRHVVPLLSGLVIISAIGAALGIWYWHERNPYHRASFPIGNPNALAAALLPGILVAAAWLGQGVRQFAATRMRGPLRTVGLTALALVPLLWCFGLTAGRAALLALAAGLAALLVARAGRRTRWLLAVVFALGLLGAGTLVYYTSRLDVTMARGATIRFRLYAWRYAAVLWNTSPIVGHGAGAYPRLAGQLATRDRVLDPGAFMAELVEHAHNELFEILAEIGLIGGVTYVGGLLATLLLALVVAQPRAPNPPRWARAALGAMLAAMVVDALLGVSLRLPGAPALFFTLLGVLWATARTMPEAGGDTGARRRRAGPAARLTALLCLLAAVGAGWFAARNWVAIQHEYRAQAAFADGRYLDAYEQIRRAESGLLDPVSQVAARELAVRALDHAAAAALDRCLDDATAPATSTGACATAVERAHATYEAALDLRVRVPSLLLTDRYAAHAAERLAELHARAGHTQEAAEWSRAAHAAWERQRQRTPFHSETLLALSRYPGTLTDHLVLLRDAQRRPTSLRRSRGRWLGLLEQLSQQPRFEAALGALRAAVGPVTPDTDLDTLIASMAPEVHRLVAAVAALRGALEEAVQATRQAVLLYEPMRPRFPLLYPTALAEQADYVLRADPAQADEAARLLEAALAALPVIQQEKYAQLASPLRYQLAVTRLALGETDEVRRLVRLMLGRQAEAPGVMPRVLAALLADAEASGVPSEYLARVRSQLATEFPTLTEPAATRPGNVEHEGAAGASGAGEQQE